jgi:hypothetical protein
MAVSSGFSLLGLLGGLMDSSSSDQLASALRDVLEFAQQPHRFVVTVTTNVDPKREDD